MTCRPMVRIPSKQARKNCQHWQLILSEPEFKRSSFSIFTASRNTIPFTGKTTLRWAMHWTNLVVGVEGHCKVYFRVWRRLAFNRAGQWVVQDYQVPLGQVIANTELFILKYLERSKNASLPEKKIKEKGGRIDPFGKWYWNSLPKTEVLIWI